MATRLLFLLVLLCGLSLNARGFAPPCSAAVRSQVRRTSYLPRTRTTPCTTAISTSSCDEILDALIEPEAMQPILMQWSPHRLSIWKRWRGTVWETTAFPTLALSCLSLALCLFAKHQGLGGVESGAFVVAVQRLNRLWQMHLTVLTFILAFYLNTAKTLFDSVLGATRQVQGRLNDMNLIAASHARRDASTGKMARQSKELCTTMGRYTRLFAVLFYSSQCRRYTPLMTNGGLAGMQQRGLCTAKESEILSAIDPKARYNAVLIWIMATFTRGCEAPPKQGTTTGDDDTDADATLIRMPANSHFAFLLRMAELRGHCATISDLVDARCPLAYVHLVQLLVDSFLILTPFASFGEMGWFSIGATFLLSLFFSGLMDLAKMLYDPLDNELFGDIDNIQVDTLIQETNNGSLRFEAAGAILPEGAQ